jgi:glycosyltransferase involved in cell wall biosynthesis
MCELTSGNKEALPLLQSRMEALGLCVVIPTYNNAGTLKSVIEDVRKYTSSVIVVNDGSTDSTKHILNRYKDIIEVVEYPENKGKGYALKTGFNRAEEAGYRGAVTIDSDSQHFAADIEHFVEAAEKTPDVFLIGQRSIEGDIPSKNGFANSFSNFWFMVQTGYKLSDTQNGFRLYPLDRMKGLRPVSSRYEAELEMLVRCAWNGMEITGVPVRVSYPPGRVTHFRPGRDFFRISVLNTVFTFAALLYGYPSMLYHKLKR